ncbi:MAG: putative porin, partial [Flavobacteriales bacterium]
MPLMHWNLVLMALLSFTAQPLLAQRTDSTRNTTATVFVDGSAKQMESDTLRRFFTYARDFDRDLTFQLVANSSELFALPFIDHTLFFSSLPINLGNIGSPLYPLYFGPPNQRTQWMSGTQSTADYHYLPENTPLFSLARPYTELTYQLGSFEEHWFQAEHAQAFAPKLYAGFSYRHINSKG